MAATIKTIMRAVTFFGVSAAQSTLSVPALAWHSEQSKPTAADMIPMVPRKSSTETPLSTWMFLKTSSAFFGFCCGAAWGAATLASHKAAIAAAAGIRYFGRRFIMCFVIMIQLPVVAAL